MPCNPESHTGNFLQHAITSSSLARLFMHPSIMSQDKMTISARKYNRTPPKKDFFFSGTGAYFRMQEGGKNNQAGRVLLKCPSLNMEDDGLCVSLEKFILWLQCY